VLNFAKYREDKLQLLEDFKEAAADVHKRYAQLSQESADKVRVSQPMHTAAHALSVCLSYVAFTCVCRPRSWSVWRLSGKQPHRYAVRV